MYVLKANTKEGVVFYMNIICITEQIECAETFETEEDAKKEMQHFKNLFHYEDIEPEIMELTKENIDYYNRIYDVKWG